jgi:hypothetical protein
MSGPRLPRPKTKRAGPKTGSPKSSRAPGDQAAAAAFSVGTSEMVFRTWEAIA